MCAGECSDTTEIEPTACLCSSDYPSKFWANRLEQGRSYTQRACCNSGNPLSENCVYESQADTSTEISNPSSKECPSESKKKGGLSTAAAYAIGIGVPIMIFVLVCGHAYYQHHKSKSAAQNQAPAARAPPPPPMAVAEPIIVPPPPPGHISGAQAAAMAQGEVIAPSAPPAPTRGSWFGSAEPEGEAAMAPEPEQAAESEK